MVKSLFSFNSAYSTSLSFWHQKAEMCYFYVHKNNNIIHSYKSKVWDMSIQSVWNRLPTYSTRKLPDTLYKYLCGDSVQTSLRRLCKSISLETLYKYLCADSVQVSLRRLCISISAETLYKYLCGDPVCLETKLRNCLRYITPAYTRLIN